MSDFKIIFSPRARERLADIADYLYQQDCSKSFVLNYLNRFESWLNKVLVQFPESGTPMPEYEADYGKDIRRVVYQKYSFVYRINSKSKDNTIEILTIYRENLP